MFLLPVGWRRLMSLVRLATNTKWAPAAHLFAAATATPITATQQSNAVFLYFQDSTKQLQQYRGSFDGGWYVDKKLLQDVETPISYARVLQDFTGPTTSTLGSVAAVSWHSEPDIWGMSQAESRYDFDAHIFNYRYISQQGLH
jgi:hypothetical protein